MASMYLKRNPRVSTSTNFAFKYILVLGNQFYLWCRDVTSIFNLQDSPSFRVLSPARSPRRYIRRIKMVRRYRNCVLLSHSLGIHMCMSYMYIGAQRIKYEIQFNTRDTPIPAGGLAHSTLQRGTALSWRAMYTYNIL